MILVDTSVWIDHFKSNDAVLIDLLGAERVLTHPWIIGELAVGRWRERQALLATLAGLPQTVPATDEEILRFIERNDLYGIGLGYIDAGLLAATILAPGTSLWTRDKRLRSAAQGLSVDAKLTH